MKRGFRQNMAWLHTWSGLLVGWVLYAVFLTGTAAYLRPEISVWARPELPAAGSLGSQGEVTQRLVDALAEMAPGAQSWFIGLPDGRQLHATAFWRSPGAGRRFESALLDPATGGRLQARDTLGGEFFYRFHFQLHYMNVPLARWIISFCAMMMLVAIISGIVTHRRIFADFFTFRPKKGQRSWMDGHAVLAVMALPYHLMITYTGLITLMLMTMPWGVERVYRGDRAAFQAEVFGTIPPLPKSGTPAPLVPIAPLVEQAEARWQGGRLGRVLVQNPGDANSRIQLVRDEGEGLSFRQQLLQFSGTTGALLAVGGDDARGAAETRGVMYGLHVGRFAGPWLRALFLLSGLAGTVMVATGCILWGVKERREAARRGARPGFGARLVEHLNIAAIAGLQIAMAVFLWANRLLPTAMPGRSTWEVHALFIAWGLCLLHPLLRPGRHGWVDQFGAAAALFALIPLLNALTTDRHLGRSLAAGDWDMAGFDLGMLACGIGLGAIAWAVASWRPSPARRGRAAMPVGASQAAAE